MNRRPSFSRWLSVLPTLLALLLAGALPSRAQDSESDSPDGPSGSYDAESTTAGRYDPYTQDAKRTVTDLTVPNSSLAFTRYYNSRQFVVSGHAVVGGQYSDYTENAYFGDGSNWRHAYQWSLVATDILRAGNSSAAGAYDVAYPDGSVITFRPGRNNAPAGDTLCWRGPGGTNDRLYVSTVSLTPNVTLLLSDGSQVFFPGAAVHPQSLTDPQGAVTQFAYEPNNPDYLSQVTDPSGRWLSFTYQTIQNQGGTNWVQLTGVTSSAVLPTTPAGPQAGAHQSVSYHYTAYGSGATPYYSLDSAIYNSEARQTGGGNVAAAYTYQTTGGVPYLFLATDPHYAGAMVNIRYLYSSANPGCVQEEQNQGSGLPVAHLDHGTSTPTTNTETRGDVAAGNGAITRQFTYGEPSTSFPSTDTNGNPITATVTTYAKGSQPTTVTDFETNAVHLAYSNYYLQSFYDAKGNHTQYGREPIVGKVTALTLPDGRQRSYVWKGKDGSTASQDANGSHFSYPYYLFSVTDERGQTTNYQRYTNTGLVYEIDYPDGSKESFAYQGFTYGGSTFYKVAIHTTKLGAQITYGYDASGHGGSGYAGLLTSVTRAYTDVNNASHTETTQLYYDSADRLSESVDPRGPTNGVVDTFTYNARHQLLTRVHGNGFAPVTCTYDDNGNCLSVADEQSHTTTTTYDEYRRVTSVTKPINDGTNTNRYVRFAYDRRDNSDNSIGSATSHTASNWSVSWVPSSKAVQRIYSPNNWLSDEYDGFYVQDAGNGTVIPHPGQGAVHLNYTYNHNGQVKTATDAQGYATSYTYDNYNRRSTATDPLGHVTTWTYYANKETAVSGSGTNCGGWLKSVSAPGPDLTYYPTATTTYANYDVMGRLLETIDPYNHTFASAYDQAGDLASQSDGAQAAGQHVTSYGHDQLGRKTIVNNPATGAQEKWTYDASGNVATFQNFAGATCTYQYDGRNQCSRYDWSNAAALSVAYTYNAVGWLKSVVNNSATVTYQYDDSGEVTQEALQPGNQSSALATGYTRDMDGNVTVITYPNTTTSPPSFAYDNQQRCTGMSSNGATYSQYNYYGNWLAGRWLSNTVYTSYGYQSNGRCTDVWHYHGGSNGSHYANASVSRHCYGYAPDGQISWFDREADGGQSGSSLENGNGDCCYYWPDGSLGVAYRNYGNNNAWPYQGNAQGDSRVDPGALNTTAATADTYGNSYTYDAAGNRNQVTQGHPAQNISYAAKGDNEYWGLSYDANFNTTDSAVGWTYTYDAENKLISAASKTAGGPVLGFSYDGLGRVIGQNNNGVLTLFYYAGAQRIEERDFSNNLRYLYFYDAPGSDQILFRQDNAGGRLWYQSDLLGNTTHLTNDAGGVVEQYLYDAYGQPSVYDAAGNARPGGSQYDNRYLFKGAGAYEWLPTAGLYYARARFYLPEHGRWLQSDPIGQAGGLNIYTYCGNDPVNGIDPSGLEGGVTTHLTQDYTDAGGGYSYIPWWDYDPSSGYDQNGRLVITGSGSPLSSEQLGVSIYSASDTTSAYSDARAASDPYFAVMRQIGRDTDGLPEVFATVANLITAPLAPGFGEVGGFFGAVRSSWVAAKVVETAEVAGELSLARELPLSR